MTLHLQRSTRLLLSSAAFLAFGCRSPFIAVKIQNHSGSALQLIEVDYPSASFGVDALSAGSVYPYRLKVQGSGPVSVVFTDQSGKQHKATGPVVSLGQQGSLTIEVGPADEVTWRAHLSAQR